MVSFNIYKKEADELEVVFEYPDDNCLIVNLWLSASEFWFCKVILLEFISTLTCSSEFISIECLLTWECKTLSYAAGGFLGVKLLEQVIDSKKFEIIWPIDSCVICIVVSVVCVVVGINAAVDCVSNETNISLFWHFKSPFVKTC